MVLNLIEDHTIWCGPLLTPRVLNLTPQFLQCTIAYSVDSNQQCVIERAINYVILSSIDNNQ